MTHGDRWKKQINYLHPVSANPFSTVTRALGAYYGSVFKKKLIIPLHKAPHKVSKNRELLLF